MSSKALPGKSTRQENKNTKRTRVKRHQPVYFSCKDLLRPHSPAKSWWSWRRELNPRPSDYKSDALPAELRQRRSNRVRIAEEVSELQGGATKYLARGWPALWKNACPLITWALVILSVIYSLARNPSSRSGPNSTGGNSPFRSAFSASDFDVEKPFPMGQSQIQDSLVQMVRRP